MGKIRIYRSLIIRILEFEIRNPNSDFEIQILKFEFRMIIKIINIIIKIINNIVKIIKTYTVFNLTLA